MTKTTSLLAITMMAAACRAEELTAAAIMERVAANQARAVAERKQWTHEQETFIRLSRSNGKMAREEIKRFEVVPSAEGFEKKLIHFEGRYQDGGKVVDYDKPGFERKDMDIDGELVDDLPDDLVNDERSRDGLDRGFFPLTTDKLPQYKFRLAGRERFKDREVYRILFEPVEKHSLTWAGEALVDTAEFQPVLITTHTTKGIPFAVRTMLGTDIQHLGFKVEYQKFADGVWFPVKYGGEFKLRALFLYRRNIAISMRNSDFRRTDVSSTIDYASVQPDTQ